MLHRLLACYRGHEGNPYPVRSQRAGWLHGGLDTGLVGMSDRIDATKSSHD